MLARKAAPHSEWIYIRLTFVEAFDGFNDLLPGEFARDSEIIVNDCRLETLLIQVRSECIAFFIGELPRVCAYPPKLVLKSQNPLFHGYLSRGSVILISVIGRVEGSVASL